VKLTSLSLSCQNSPRQAYEQQYAQYFEHYKAAFSAQVEPAKEPEPSAAAAADDDSRTATASALAEAYYSGLTNTQ
jgi:hypothetical protein